MKLLNSFVSPFASRVRLGIYAHDLPVEIAPSGQWTPDFRKAPAYLEINPIGRVPTLMLDDGTALPESAVILEYLADAFPEEGLRPPGAEAAAKDRLLAHLMEIYFQEKANALFPQLFAQQRDGERIASIVAGMDEGLSYVEHFLGSGARAPEAAITLGDCAMIVYLYFFADLMVHALGQPPIIPRHPQVARYWEAVQDVPAVQKLFAEMRAGIGQSRLRTLLSPDV